MASTKRANKNYKLNDQNLFSFGIFDFFYDVRSLEMLEKFVDLLSQRYKYFEILITSRNNDIRSKEELLKKIKDIRILTVPETTSMYSQRVLLLEEAIGDVILITNFMNISFNDLIKLTEESKQSQFITYLRGDHHKKKLSINSIFLSQLGKASGFYFDTSILSSVAIPREQVGLMLARHDSKLALRFPPRNSNMKIKFRLCEVKKITQIQKTNPRERWVLLIDLLTRTSPMFLFITSLSSLLMTLLGTFFSIYVFFVWLFVEKVAEGWLSISLALSASLIFLGVSFLGLSLCLQNILKILNFDQRQSFSELNNNDLFQKITEELNVETRD